MEGFYLKAKALTVVHVPHTLDSGEAGRTGRHKAQRREPVSFVSLFHTVRGCERLRESARERALERERERGRERVNRGSNRETEKDGVVKWRGGKPCGNASLDVSHVTLRERTRLLSS